MERLTNPGTVYNFANLDPVEQKWLERVQAKLAVYEDTGLTPGEINSLRMDMAIIKALFEYMEVDRMKELAQADKDGRLIIIPEPSDGLERDLLEPMKVGYALKSEIMKLNMRLARDPKSVSHLDYTIIAALQAVLEGGGSDA